jgi:negative regulator of flagellin synthesis FlgM
VRSCSTRSSFTCIASGGHEESRRLVRRGAGKSAAPDGEKVELTSSARLLERQEKSFASLPEIDRARVEAVKTAIANGEYQIDAGRIAAALLRTEQQLGG